ARCCQPCFDPWHTAVRSDAGDVDSMAQWNPCHEGQPRPFRAASSPPETFSARDRNNNIHPGRALKHRRPADEPGDIGMGRRHNERHRLLCLPLGISSDESRYAFMSKKRVVIIGGGLAGTSAGYHLAEYDPIIFEKESEIGGLCRSFTQDGF